MLHVFFFLLSLVIAMSCNVMLNLCINSTIKYIEKILYIDIDIYLDIFYINGIILYFIYVLFMILFTMKHFVYSV